MDKINQDILAEHTSLRNNPYTVPEGYFETVRTEVKRVRQEPAVTIWSRLAPYASLAAVFVSIFAAGSLLFNRNEQEMTQEDYLLFSEHFLTTYEMENSLQFAEAEIEDNDIVEYLIYTGTTAEEIEMSK